MKRHRILVSVAFLFVPLAACDGTFSVGSDDGGGTGANEAGKRSDGCVGNDICLSTVSCTSNADCTALGSTCDTCSKLCGCGTTGSGDGGADGGGGEDGGAVCRSNADCDPTDICGFEASLACTAQGHCFAAPQVTCELYAPGCACDGTEINTACNGLPDGYDTKPLRHTGACEGGTDAGGGACSSNADCGPTDICGFEASLACTAQGQCFPAQQVTCLAYSEGCACDGTEINIACNGLPPGYDTKPLRHTGACEGGTEGGTKEGGTKEGGTLPDGCAGGGYICLSTVSCTTDVNCKALGLGSSCDPCTKLCGCGVADAGEAGTDAAGRSCTTDADCGSGVCGFEASLACAAQGQCFPGAGSGMVCTADLPGCACDGTEINTACNGLPPGYNTKPLKHTGACDGGTGL